MKLDDEQLREHASYYVGYWLTRWEEHKPRFTEPRMISTGQLEGFFLAEQTLALLAPHFPMNLNKRSKVKEVGKMPVKDIKASLRTILKECQDVVLSNAAGIVNSGELNSTSATVRYMAAVRLSARAGFIKEWEGKL